MTRRSSYDAIIVGGGPAGLSAALILGRCRRTVLLCDTGRPRNAASRAPHGFLSRDGIPPRDLLRIGRRQISRYGVELGSTEVTDARWTRSGFEVVLHAGHRLSARTLLTATGVVENGRARSVGPEDADEARRGSAEKRRQRIPKSLRPWLLIRRAAPQSFRENGAASGQVGEAKVALSASQPSEPDSN